MTELQRCPPTPSEVDDSGTVSVAVRPSRLQIAAVRLSLLLHGTEGRVPVGVAMFVLGVGFSVGGLQFLSLVARYGLVDALLISAPGIVVLLLSSIAGIGTLLFHASRGADRLSEIEMESGVLLQLAPSGFAATIRGVTTYYDWEHVALHETPGGIAFVLPRRTFHLLPWSALTPDQTRRLRNLLDGVALGVPLGCGSAHYRRFNRRQITMSGVSNGHSTRSTHQRTAIVPVRPSGETTG